MQAEQVTVSGRKVTKSMITHGHCGAHGKKTPTYYSWEKMKERCYNSRNVRYAHYGGRGVKVCLRWHKFANFLSDMGIRPKDMTLDRKEVHGHYEPTNCKWSTVAEQNANRATDTRMICGCGVDDRPCAVHF